MRKRSAASGLVPPGTLQHVNDDAALDLVHDLEQGRLRLSAEAANRAHREAAAKIPELKPHAADDFLAANALGRRSGVNALLRERTTARLNHVFQFAQRCQASVIHHQLIAAA